MVFAEDDEPSIHVLDPADVPGVIKAMLAPPLDYLARLAETRSGRAHLSRYYKGRAGLARRRSLERQQRDSEASQPIPFEMLRDVARELWGIELPDDFGFEDELRPDCNFMFHRKLTQLPEQRPGLS